MEPAVDKKSEIIFNDERIGFEDGATRVMNFSKDHGESRQLKITQAQIQRLQRFIHMSSRYSPQSQPSRQFIRYGEHHGARYLVAFAITEQYFDEFQSERERGACGMLILSTSHAISYNQPFYDSPGPRLNGIPHK